MFNTPDGAVAGGGGNPPVTVNVTPPPEGQYFTAQQLEAARQQEKDKVYGRIEAAERLANEMKAEVEALKADKAARDAEAQRLQQEAAAAQQRAEDEKLTAAQLIEKNNKELLERQQAFEAKLAADQALLQKEQQFLQLRAYIQQRIAEEVAQDNIAPEFLDYISGNTQDEVEASITKAKEKTASIIEAKVNAGVSAPRLPGVSPTGFAPTGPLEQFQGQQRELTVQEIDALSMPEYAEYRKQRGIDRAGKDRGMFG